MTGTREEWRVLDGITTAWFEAPSLTEAASLAGRIIEVSPDASIDVRTTGLRVRLEAGEHADAVSAAARDLALTADPGVLQQVGVVLESGNPAEAGRFWGDLIGYEPAGESALADPLRRDPTLRLEESAEPRPLRQRLHLDVVRPAAVVEHVSPGEPSGPYGVRHADPEGTEVDLVPGGPLEEGSESSDWQAVFSAMACCRVGSTTVQRDLVLEAARLADGAGFPLMIDVRPGLVILDSGKDQWERDAHGLDVDFTALAVSLQAAARDRGATADLEVPRFVQLFLDAADVDAVRAFWLAALDYTADERPGVTDIYDPRRLNPVLVFQDIDLGERERRHQRNRFHVELKLPADQAEARVAAAVDAGGRILDQADDQWRVADPEGNELAINAGA